MTKWIVRSRSVQTLFIISYTIHLDRFYATRSFVGNLTTYTMLNYYNVPSNKCHVLTFPSTLSSEKQQAGWPGTFLSLTIFCVSSLYFPYPVCIYVIVYVPPVLTHLFCQ